MSSVINVKLIVMFMLLVWCLLVLNIEGRHFNHVSQRTQRYYKEGKKDSRELPRHFHRYHINKVPLSNILRDADSPFSQCGVRTIPSKSKREYKRSKDHPRYRYDLYYHNRLYPRIIGGVEAQRHSWPWQALIRYRGPSSLKICSGAIVSRYWIVTSAQCIPSKNPKEYLVILGGHDKSSLTGEEKVHRVHKVVVPPIFNQHTLQHDIALIQLKTPVKRSSNINYICLPDAGAYVNPGTKCHMTGWGYKRTSKGFPAAHKLQDLIIPAVSDRLCSTKLNKKIDDTKMCAGYSSGTRGGCKFDEGSPLVCYNKTVRRWYLQGLFSYSSSSCSSDATRYSIFTRMSMYSSIIKEAVIKPPSTKSPPTKPVPSTKIKTTASLTTKMITSTSIPPTTTSTPMTTNTSTTTNTPTTISTSPTLGKRSSKKMTTTGYPLPPFVTGTTRTGPTTKLVTTAIPSTVAFKKQVSVNIYLRSEACNDVGITEKPCGGAYILVNGIDYSKHKRGHNVVVVDLKTGKIEASENFDTASSSIDAIRFRNFLSNIRLRKIVLIVIQGDGTRFQSTARHILIRLGATLPFEISPKSSFCLIGYSGPDHVSWIRQESHPQYSGPSYITEIIPPPRNDAVVRIRVKSQSCAGKQKKLSEHQTYIWVNGIDLSPHINGHNLVILNFDTGKLMNRDGFNTTRLDEARRLERVLKYISHREIIIVAVQCDGSRFHSIMRKNLGLFGATSKPELIPGSSYVFIGFSGPEKVYWTTEVQKPPNSGPADVTVFARKGYHVCGLKATPPSRESFFIVGGKEAKRGQWPWMAAILDGNGRFICGGALVSAKWVITAAHCILDLRRRPEPHRVALGSHLLSRSSAAVIKPILKMYIHPSYNVTDFDYDIGMLELSTKVTIKDHIRTVCLPDMNEYKYSGDCYISGWGRKSTIGTFSDTLQEVKVPLISREICNHAKSYKGKITPQMFCAGIKTGGIDSCQGDSGGPLSCQDRDGRWSLTGVVSWGHGCAEPHLYGVYTNVSVVSPWIRSFLNK